MLSLALGVVPLLGILVPLRCAPRTKQIANIAWSSQQSLSSIKINAPTDHRESLNSCLLSESDVNPYPIKQLQH